MSILSDIEAEISDVYNSAKSTVEKLEAFVGLHQKVQELTDLKTKAVTIINDVTQTAEAKAEAIMALFKS